MPKGYTSIRAKFIVKAQPEVLSQIRELAAFSPMFNTVSCGTNVDVEVVMKQARCSIPEPLTLALLGAGLGLLWGGVRRRR